MVTNSRYKQTELGVIPADWELKRIGDIADVKGGKRLPSGSVLTDKPTKHPYIRVVDMYYGGVRSAGLKYVPDEAFPQIKNYTISSDDIFISVAGTLGIVGRIPVELSGANLTENADKITNISCDKDYLLYCLMSTRIQDTIESEKTIGAQPKLALTRIQNFLVALPQKLSEQRAIAAALSDTDDLIAGLERLIAKKRGVKQAAMQQLLTGKTRLPGFVGEWEVKRIGDVLKLRYGESQKGIAAEDGLYPIIGTSGVVARTNSFVFDRPSVIIGRKGTIDAPLFVGTPFWAIDTTFYSDISARSDAKYLYYLFTTVDWRTYNEASGVPSLSAKTVENISLLLPSVSEQRAIAAVLSDMDAEIAALERQREKTRMLKQGMMQELLTGRTRLV